MLPQPVSLCGSRAGLWWRPRSILGTLGMAAVRLAPLQTPTEVHGRGERSVAYEKTCESEGT